MMPEPIAMGCERFLILTRAAGPASANLQSILDAFGRVEVVVDDPAAAADGRSGQAVWIPDELAQSFGGVHSTSGAFPWISAWSRALCHLARTSQAGEDVWFVEDDVAGDAASFAVLVEGTRQSGRDLAAIDVSLIEEDLHWPYWHLADGFFHHPARAFVPLCRLSGRLMAEVLALCARHGRSAFTELMFASVAREAGMSWLSWNQHPSLRRCFGEFRYRPEVVGELHGISHPVKTRPALA